jgi:hypothetical protein
LADYPGLSQQAVIGVPKQSLAWLAVPLIPFVLLPFAHPDAGTTAVLADELHPCKSNARLSPGLARRAEAYDQGRSS